MFKRSKQHKSKTSIKTTNNKQQKEFILIFCFNGTTQNIKIIIKTSRTKDGNFILIFCCFVDRYSASQPSLNAQTDWAPAVLEVGPLGRASSRLQGVSDCLYPYYILICIYTTKPLSVSLISTPRSQETVSVTAVAFVNQPIVQAPTRLNNSLFVFL